MRTMKNKVMLLVAMMIWLSSCEETQKKAQPKVIGPVSTSKECGNQEKLLYSKDGFSTYTDDKIRGKGVVSFELAANDRLSIYNEDDSEFGYLVLNEDQTFFTLQMPKKLLARKVIPEFDFAAFDFDAEDENTSKKYLLIYANGMKKKVKKAELQYSYKGWSEYLKEQSVALKPCNPLKNVSNGGQNLLFEVMAVDGDRMNIKSSTNCASGGGKQDYAEGSIRWRKKDLLLVDLKSCN